MDRELIEELGLPDKDTLNAIEYAQKCVAMYERTMKAMGISYTETISQGVENSQVAYNNPPETGDRYADVPDNY